MDPPVRVGIAGAAAAVPGSLARGLLPRTVAQQAMASGIVAGTHYELTATTWATLQAIGALPGDRPGVRANLTLAGVGVAAGVAMNYAMMAPAAATAQPSQPNA